MGHRRSGAQDGLLGYCYERSPICVPDGSAPIPIERRDFVAAARPGTRAPHAWLGEGRSTLDLFGDGFVLLRFGGRQWARASPKPRRVAASRCAWSTSQTTPLLRSTRETSFW
ncbi:MAG TPA: hypothetical protein VJR47_20175 [Stellaceae bacterium]|nr:hypothetical protein [Stellaceae bacterium]